MPEGESTSHSSHKFLAPPFPHTVFTRKQDRLWPKLAVGMPLAAKAARRKDAPHSHIITNYNSGRVHHEVKNRNNEETSGIKRRPLHGARLPKAYHDPSSRFGRSAQHVFGLQGQTSNCHKNAPVRALCGALFQAETCTAKRTAR